MSRSRNTEKSWQNAYLTEQRQPSGVTGAGRFTSGYINPAARAAARNAQAVARNRAMQGGGKKPPKAKPSGGASVDSHGIGTDPEDQHEAAQARALMEQAADIEHQIDRLTKQLKSAKSNLAAAQQGAAAGGAAGASATGAAANAAAAARQAAAGTAAGAAGATQSAQSVAAAQASVNDIKGDIRQLKAQRQSLLKRARALLRDARKGAKPSTTKGSRVASVLTPEATKASVMTGESDMVYMSVPIEKSEDTDTVNPVDGTPDVIIAGKCTDGTLDSDLQVVDPEASERWIKTWYDTKANIRMGHDPKRPVGRGIQVDGHYIKALIADPVAKHLIRQKILNDFSIGIMHPDVRKGDPRFKHLDPMGKAVGGIITDRPDGLTQLGEISVVDRGANFGASFSLVKTAADGSAEWVNKLSAPDDLLAKVGAPALAKSVKAVKSVNVDLPANMSLSIKPSDLAKLQTLGRRLAVEEAANKAAAAALTKAAEPEVAKRDFDANVGGGVDRDKLPASDFAGRDRSFPIVTAADVSDALLSIGRAGPENYSHAKLRRNILRIARRKGFPIPEADRKKKDRKAEKTSRPDRKVTRDVARAEGATSRAERAQDADPDARTDPADRKVTRDLRDADGALRRAGKDQAADNDAPKGKRKKARKAAAPAVTKKKKVMCTKCGAMQSRKHAACSECGAALEAAPDVTKNHDFRCLGCGHDLDKGEKHCPGCGKENPGYNPMADMKIPANKGAKGERKKRAKKGKKGKPFGGKEAPPFGEDTEEAATKAGKGRVNKGKKKSGKKGKGRTPGRGVTGEHMTPAGPHREPDGAEVEAFEADSHMSDGDHEKPTRLEARTLKSADPEMAAALALRALGVPGHIGALHALTCPAYKPKHVAKAFPRASLADIDPGEWQAATLTKAASAPIAEVQAAMALGQHAMTLKSTDPYLLADLRAEAHKAFRDANPGPSHFPTPGELSPERFRRPLITAGHEAASPGHKEPHHVQLPPEGGIGAQDYTRGYISEGHAADAPENGKRPEPMPAPGHTGVPTSGPARRFYTNAARDGARHAMEAMHDHIAQTFPDLCPMHGADDIARHPVPTPEGVPGVKPAPGKKGKKVKKGAKAKARKNARPAKKAPRRPQRAAKSAALDPEVLKAAMAEANAPLLARIAAQDAALKAAGKGLRKQRKMLHAIAGQPDTSHAPFRGVALTKSSAPAVQAPSMAGLAEQAQLSKMALLAHEATNSPDPGRREAARAEWQAMAGLAPMNSYNATPMNPRM